MLTLDEARAILLDGVRPLPAETLAIGQSAGRILAADVTAARDQPPAAMSAMDGYAIRAEDAHADARLRVIGEAPAGGPYPGNVGPGEAVRIATGGVVPAGADQIVIQENVARDGDLIRLVEPSPPNAFIRPAGCDFAAGETVARAGETLTPARLALVAAANAGQVAVYRRPRVTILPSGDELREPGGSLAPAEIVNSATYAIAALAETWGAEAVRRPILPDDPDACARRLRDLDLEADAIVTLGGASVGERDSLRPVFQTLGAVLLFERIAVQPGKPCWHARFGDGRRVLGLPGNPASAFVCAHLLLKPLLAALTGRDPVAAPLTATLTQPIPATGARETYLRAATAVDRSGQLRVTSMARQDSSLLTPLAAADALIRRPAFARAAEIGEPVEILAIA